MFSRRLFRLIKSVCINNNRRVSLKLIKISPVTLGLLSTAFCENKQQEFDLDWNADNLEHDFLIRQATTVSVNAATQLLTVTLVAIQDTSERLRETLAKEICLVKQALELGENSTPPHHWDQLVAVRGALCDLNHNLRTLFSYMDYAEKLATTAAEISYLSGNIVASDAICDRIDFACRACDNQKKLTQELQQESLELQQQAIISAPHLEDKLKSDPNEKNT